MVEETRPAWMLDEGMDADMTGDVRPGSGAGLRFWIPKGQDRTIIFLTDGNKARVIWEHNICLGGNWRNWATCIAPLGVACPLCIWAEDHDNQFARYKGAFLTVIDTHEFKDKAGKVHKNERKIMCCKKDTIEVLKRKYLTRIENGQTLRGAMYKAFRPNSDKSPAVGSDFEYIKMVDLASLPEKDELDMATLLAPDPARVQKIVDQLRRGSADPVAGGAVTDGTSDAVTY